MPVDDWMQTAPDRWSKRVLLPFGTVIASVYRVDDFRADYVEDGWLVTVAVDPALDPRYEDWTTGYIPPLPFSEAQAECDQIIGELITYGPGEWIPLGSRDPSSDPE
jgi:hypothetical protein